MMLRLLSLMLLTSPLFAAEVTKLTISPESIGLHSPFAYAQVVVTAHYDDGTTQDVTRVAKPQHRATISVTPTGLVRPSQPGTNYLRYDYQGKHALIGVAVTLPEQAKPVSFIRDAQPLLGKLGCNAGTCHGAQQGKNGFKLSLRGYDPQYDHRALTDDLEARRFNRADPGRSLMLMKAAGEVPHVGGALMTPADANYQLLREWIAQGVKFDAATKRAASLEIFPKNPTIQTIGDTQQFRVVATYPDGKTRDVTLETFIDSSNTEVATVDKAGLLKSVRRGEATILARYEGAYAASTVVVMGDRTGFVWKDVWSPEPLVRNAGEPNEGIDGLVDAKLKRIKVQLSDMCTDEEFIRRIHLDLTGLPPTPETVRKFLSDKEGSRVKRLEMIDSLIGSPAFVDHWANKWADLLQVNRKFLGQPGAKALKEWIAKAVKENMPYDQFAYAILTGSGSQIENPPASYYKILRDSDSVMENTTQLFLAIRFNCNKCHDHPFERWTQDQYYQMSAYFAQVDRKEDPKYKGQRVGGTAVEKPIPLSEIISDVKTGDVKHARTGLVTPPMFPFTHADMPKDGTRREQLAKWTTSAKNPYFAKSYVNRVWSYLTGVGVIEPVDDIRAGNPPTNPELLDYLTKFFIEKKFDTRALIREIVRSRTYQLSVTTNAWNKDDDANYSHAMARRLPAEVLFDSVYAATGSPSKLPGLPVGSRAAQLLDSNVELPGGFLELLGKPVRESVCECERGSSMMLGPVLAFVSGPVVGDAVQDPASRLAAFTAKETNDTKVVEEIYLSVLNRYPSKDELASGITALKSAAGDHAALLAEQTKKKDVFVAYLKTIDERQAKWEAGLLAMKPTAWTVLKPTKASGKAGATPATADKKSKLEIRPDGSIVASGSPENYEGYTVETEVTSKDIITGFKLEVLTDDALPKKGPGRSENGNFVLNTFSAKFHTKDKKDATLKFENPEATFSQAGFEIGKAIDNDRATGWAISPQMGKDHAAVVRAKTATAVNKFDASKGLTLTFNLEQSFGTGHSLGKFRLSYTTDKDPKLAAPVAKEMIALLEVPVKDRTPKQAEELRAKYLAQDMEYQKLRADADKVVPSDPRVLGAQDLTWALLNNPAFLFNR